MFVATPKDAGTATRVTYSGLLPETEYLATVRSYESDGRVGGFSAILSFTTAGDVGIDTRESNRKNEILALYPNPVSSVANLVFAISIPSNVRVRVFDVIGREVLVAHRGHRHTL